MEMEVVLLHLHHGDVVVLLDLPGRVRELGPLRRGRAREERRLRRGHV